MAVSCINRVVISDAEFVSQELLLGTHTSDEEDNFIQFLNMDLPVKGQDTPTGKGRRGYK
jgi:hypothetical protein